MTNDTQETIVIDLVAALKKRLLADRTEAERDQDERDADSKWDHPRFDR